MIGDALAAALLHDIGALAARYYALTGKPLGVTGEVAELAAAELLGLELCPARTAGFDAWNKAACPKWRVQIKGRAVDPADRYRGRCPAIKVGDLADDVVLVLLDRTTFMPLEIWLASEADVAARLAAPGSKARNQRNSMGIAQFKSIADKIWLA